MIHCISLRLCISYHHAVACVPKFLLVVSLNWVSRYLVSNTVCTPIEKTRGTSTLKHWLSTSGTSICNSDCTALHDVMTSFPGLFIFTVISQRTKPWERGCLATIEDIDLTSHQLRTQALSDSRMAKRDPGNEVNLTPYSTHFLSRST